MPAQTHVRAMDEDDLNAVVEIDRKVLGTKRREFWKRKIEYTGIYPRPAFVAEVEGKVVGFILGYVSGWEFGVPDTVGWIDTLGVDPDYQRQGIGTTLFNALIDSFKSSGKETKPAAKGEKSQVEGVNVVYTLAGWDDWDLLQFYHKMGLNRGKMLNLELGLR